jgi:hypothetical protein
LNECQPRAAGRHPHHPKRRSNDSEHRSDRDEIEIVRGEDGSDDPERRSNGDEQAPGRGEMRSERGESDLGRGETPSNGDNLRPGRGEMPLFGAKMLFLGM